MIKITSEGILPIDFLYEVNGGEDRRHAPELLVQVYELLIEKREYVEKFNAMMDRTFPNGVQPRQFIQYLADRKHIDEILRECVLSVEKDNPRIVPYLAKYYGLIADNLTNT